MGGKSESTGKDFGSRSFAGYLKAVLKCGEQTAHFKILQEFILGKINSVSLHRAAVS